MYASVFTQPITHLLKHALMKPENDFSKLRAKHAKVNRPSVNLYSFIALGLSVVVCGICTYMRDIGSVAHLHALLSGVPNTLWRYTAAPGYFCAFYQPIIGFLSANLTPWHHYSLLPQCFCFLLACNSSSRPCLIKKRPQH